MGTKLREKDITGSGTTRTDYCGNVIYENGALTKLLTDNGYVTLSDNKYHFYFKDHEGNNRVVADQSNTVEQVNNYYPFGLLYRNDASTSANKYKYNGKELQTQHGLDWCDYGARFYDPELCQWHMVDILCEKYYSTSPYTYCMDNPMHLVDISGKKLSIQMEILFILIRMGGCFMPPQN
jgi:RHS repeat-associated protein